MQKIVFIMVCFCTAFILSCGNSETEQSCVTALDCQDGKICSGGTCVDPNSSDNGSENDSEISSDDNSELPDDNNVSGGDKTDSDTSTSDKPENPDTPNDNDAETPETPDAPNDGDAEPISDSDSVSDNDTEPVVDSDSVSDNDTEPVVDSDSMNDNDTEPVTDSDTVNDNDAEPVSDSDSVTDNDTEPVSDSDSMNDNDTEPAGDSDTEINEDDPLSDWDSSPDDEVVCEFVMHECINPITNGGCLPEMEKEFPNYCNGLDDDCDGKVDEGCYCEVGQVQTCFSGAPNKRNVGTCQDGTQSCVVGPDGKTGTWGDCTGDIVPRLMDECASADDDCNGCIDDGLCCNPPVNCSYDIGTALPFTDKIIDGNQIYDTSHLFNDAATANWEWTLTKGPCDVVLGKTSFSLTSAVDGVAGTITNAADSVTFSGIGLSKFKVNFQLSGSYTLHLKITRTNGDVHECKWPLKVISDGLRIELCWDTTGAHLSGGRDLDLHLGKNGATEDVYGTCNDYTGWTEDTACSYLNCRNDDWDVSGWGYADTASGKNPRLDIDNIHDVGKPENINVDNPNNGDTFRVLVRLFPWSTISDSSEQYGGDVNTHPVVNVYCGGTLKATYGVSPQYILKNEDDSWKVVEIKWVGGVGSDECQLTPNLVIVSGNVPFYDNW